MEKINNLKSFIENILPKLNNEFKVVLLNEKSNHYRFIKGSKKVDYFPTSKKIVDVDNYQSYVLCNDGEIYSWVKRYLS